LRCRSFVFNNFSGSFLQKSVFLSHPGLFEGREKLDRLSLRAMLAAHFAPLHRRFSVPAHRWTGGKPFRQSMQKE